MKTNPNFELRTICDEQVIVSIDSSNISLGRLMVFNPSAAFLWKSVVGKEFTLKHLADLLCDTYGIIPEKAENDAQAVINQWKELGLIL